MLTFWLSHFLLSWVAQQHFVETFVRDKAGTNFVVVQPLFALIREFFGDIEVGVLSRFDDVGVDFEGKGSEISIVDAPSSDDVFFDVLSKGANDEMELRLGVKGFNSFIGSGLRTLMFSWVVPWVGNDPE